MVEITQLSLDAQKMKVKMIRLGDTLNGRYIIESFNHGFEKSGGIGIVYKARDIKKKYLL